MPAPDRGDDFVWVGGPGEGLRLLIVVLKEAVDRGLQVDDGSKDAALEPALCRVAKKPSTALSQDADSA